MPTYNTAADRLENAPWPHFRVVMIAELRDRALVNAIRKTCFFVTTRFSQKKINASMWFSFLVDTYEEMRVTIVNQKGHPVFLNTEVFEPTDEEIDAGEWSRVTSRRTEFFEYNCCTAPSQRGGFVHKRWRRQFAVMASIVGAHVPEQSRHWPRVTVQTPLWDLPIPANDNRRR